MNAPKVYRTKSIMNHSYHEKYCLTQIFTIMSSKHLKDEGFRFPLQSKTLQQAHTSKRVITAIYSYNEHKITPASLLIEYHNVHQLVVNANKNILQRRYAGSIGIGCPTDSSLPGPSTAGRLSREELDAAEITLNVL